MVRKNITTNIQERLNKAARHTASLLSEKTAGYTPASWKLLLTGFCLAASCLCCITAMRPVSIKVTAVSMHRSTGNRLQEAQRPTIRLPVRLVRLRAYLDSLSASEEGIRIRDSFSRQHTGMIDSLLLVEKIYLKNDQ